MRRSTIVVVATLALLRTGVAVTGQSSDPLMTTLIGNWRLNVAKSTYSPAPPPRSNASKWEPSEGGTTRITTDGMSAQGQATHTEWIGKFDGKDYPQKGVPEANTTRAYKGFDDRTYKWVEKVDGKVTLTTRNIASRDGKTRTATTTGKNVTGQTVNNVMVREKQ